MRLGTHLLAALCVVWAGCAGAQACSNASTTITIPSSGSALMTVYDQSCNPLAGPFSVQVPGSSLSASTSPAVQVVGSGSSTQLQFTANGAACGASNSGTIQFTAASPAVSTPFSYVVCGKVTSISLGTTTP